MSVLDSLFQVVAIMGRNYWQVTRFPQAETDWHHARHNTTTARTTPLWSTTALTHIPSQNRKTPKSPQNMKLSNSCSLEHKASLQHWGCFPLTELCDKCCQTKCFQCSLKHTHKKKTLLLPNPRTHTKMLLQHQSNKSRLLVIHGARSTWDSCTIMSVKICLLTKALRHGDFSGVCVT